MDLFGSLLSGLGLQAKNEKIVSVEECASMVLQLLAKCKVEPKSAEIEVEGGRGWVITRGSASIIILIAKNEYIDDFTLEVYSPILKLPTQNILPFYRRCLEINRYLVNSALCVQKDDVIVMSERPLRGIDYEEVESLILSVANAADMIDDKLAEEFGAKLASES